jgi:DNA-binding NarL/FixJ family response regulator
MIRKPVEIDHSNEAIEFMGPKPFILIVEDHPLYKQALDSLMRLSFPDALVVTSGQARDAFDFIDAQAEETVAASVLLLDMGLPGLSGLELIDEVHSRYPHLTVVVISGSDDPLRVSVCLGSGVRAFVSKSTPPDRIVELIGRGLRSELTEALWLSAEGQRSLDTLQQVHLTSRQVQVLSLICQGYTNKQIADALQIIEATAKAHVSAIFKELGVVSRTQALLAAQRLGFKEQAA